MNWRHIKGWASEWLNKKLFTIAGSDISLNAIVIFLVILALTYLVSKVVQRAIRRFFGRSFVGNEGTLLAVIRLVHYLIMLVGLGIALQTIGIKMNALFAAGAVFAIAIGFAMQNIVQNFVSGIILLVERSIKPGDVLEIDGNIIRVEEMGIRTTVARTWREEDIIIPNSTLSQHTVKNYTLKDRQSRVGVNVGVSYDSDMNKVMEVLEKTARSMPWQLKKTEPRILLQDFGSSSVDFSIYLTVNDPWQMRVYQSDLRKAIWFALKDAGITIAYPQVDVHLDPPVEEGLTRIGKVIGS